MYARAREDLAEYQAGEIVKIADNQELERRQSEVRENRPPTPHAMLAGSACGDEGGSPLTRKYPKIPEAHCRPSGSGRRTSA